MDNNVNVKINLVDNVSKPIDNAAANVQKSSNKMQASAKKTAGAFGDITKALVTMEMMKKTFSLFSNTMTKMEDFQPVAKSLQKTFSDIQVEVGSALLPTITDLAGGFEVLGKHADIVGRVIGGSFSGIVTVIKFAAVGIFKALEGAVVAIESASFRIAKTPLIPLQWRHDAIKTATAMAGLAQTFRIASEDMAADAKKTLETTGDIFKGDFKRSEIKKETPEVIKPISSKQKDDYAESMALTESWVTEIEDMAENMRISQIEQADKLRDELFAIDSEITQKEREESEKRIAQAQKESDARWGAASSLANGMAALMTATAGKSKQAQERAKKIAVAAAVIDTIASTIKAFNAGMSTGGPWAPAIAAAYAAGAGAFGFAQVAAIQAQQFAQGGIVGGTSFTGDRVPAMLNSGEMILNREQQTRLFDMIDSGRSGTGLTIGGDTIIIQGNADQSTVRAIRQTREDQLREMRGMLRELRVI